MNGSRLFDLYGNASEWTRDTDGYRLETVSGTTLCVFSSPTARVRLRESDCASPTARVRLRESCVACQPWRPHLIYCICP